MPKTSTPKKTKFEDPVVARVTVDTAGRMIIPANIRKIAGIEPGQTFTLTVSADRKVIEMKTIQLAIDEAQALMRKKLKGRKVSVVDDLIAERRAEAKKE